MAALSSGLRCASGSGGSWPCPRVSISPCCRPTFFSSSEGEWPLSLSLCSGGVFILNLGRLAGPNDGGWSEFIGKIIACTAELQGWSAALKPDKLRQSRSRYERHGGLPAACGMQPLNPCAGTANSMSLLLSTVLPCSPPCRARQAESSIVFGKARAVICRALACDCLVYPLMTTIYDYIPASKDLCIQVIFT